MFRYPVSNHTMLQYFMLCYVMSGLLSTVMSYCIVLHCMVSILYQSDFRNCNFRLEMPAEDLAEEYERRHKEQARRQKMQVV